MFYGPIIWDPVLIIAQMGVMQASFYLLTGFWLVLLQSLLGSRTGPSLDHIFKPSTMDLDSVLNVAPILALILAAPLCAIICTLVVDRAWQCLDFAGSVYFVHLILCCCHSGFPLYWEWWASNVFSLVVTVLLSEHWVVKKEQEPIEMEELTR
mmetsp:Transcript_21174/g.29685  ORF Transcript_21174/g.29685 Transcript_21174/m.29685 type:complete len:153 (+) Transcript_21174:53-511(+)